MADITITWADVTANAPELAAVSLGAQAEILDQVGEQVRTSSWGSLKRANIGALWLARHLGTRSLKRKGGQILQGVTVDGVHKTFAANFGEFRPAKVELMTTDYGREFLRLAAAWCPRAALT